MKDSKLWIPEGWAWEVPSDNVLRYELSSWMSKRGNAQRILFLNLMPEKVKTENDFVRILSQMPRDIQLLPMKIRNQRYKTTPQAYVDANYLDFEDYSRSHFDKLIITGAPLEQMPFENVRYWNELCHIMEWAEEHVRSSLYICWGAQAGLYKWYGVPKYGLSDKMFGIFSQRVLVPHSLLMKGLCPVFLMPNSRHTEVRSEDIRKHSNNSLQIIAESEESGVGVIATEDCHRVFIVGHLEYASTTLDDEYRRDLSKHLPIKEPLHYYAEDGTIDFSWRKDALQFYRNWVEL